MPAALVRRILLCLLIAASAITTRVLGMAFPPVVEVLVFGAAVVAAAFLLAWAAEAAQKDISGALAIALVGLSIAWVSTGERPWGPPGCWFGSARFPSSRRPARSSW